MKLCMDSTSLFTNRLQADALQLTHECSDEISPRGYKNVQGKLLPVVSLFSEVFSALKFI
jgi:hypothetical protein